MEPVRDEAGLIDRAGLRDLDPRALDAFVKATMDRTFSLVFRILGHREEAEDVTQEVYERAFKALPAYRGEAQPETWLWRIAVNAARDAIGRKSRERSRRNGVDADDVAVSNDPGDHAVATEERGRLETALARLSAEKREMIVLAEIEEMSHEDIAGILDISVGTVKSRLHRARQALREEYRLGERARR